MYKTLFILILTIACIPALQGVKKEGIEILMLNDEAHFAANDNTETDFFYRNRIRAQMRMQQRLSRSPFDEFIPSPRHIPINPPSPPIARSTNYRHRSNEAIIVMAVHLTSFFAAYMIGRYMHDLYTNREKKEYQSKIRTAKIATVVATGIIALLLWHYNYTNTE